MPWRRRDGGQVSWFENLGGQYRVASSEGEVNNSAPQFVQPVVFTHRGRLDDSPLRANILTIQFLLNTQPMTPAQAKLYFKRIRIAQDSYPNGIFDDGRDIVIAESSDLRLDGIGRLRLQVSGSDSALVTTPGATKRYYIVAERLARNCGVALGATAIDATQARIFHVVTAQTAVNAETGTALRAEYVRDLDGDDADPYFRPAVIINELMADNNGTLEDPDEPLEYPDWIELYNPSSIELDLGGMYLSDDPDQPRLSRIPDGVRIPGKGYLVLIADGEPEQGPLHLNLKLSKGGDTVSFYDAPLRGSRLLDQVVYEGMGPDISVGRYPNGSTQWQTLGVPTPGAYNLMEPLVIRNTFFMPLIASDTSCR
ncbi:MAG: lamin tail domain-containing protein [Anaerolineales bacterium]|nr:lamin tail domain-containing protein [Anaerolineales bacterium]